MQLFLNSLLVCVLLLVAVIIHATDTINLKTIQASALQRNLKVQSDYTAIKDIDEKKLGVLLLNLGGPQNNEDVEGFLYNLFSDPDIIRLPKLLSFLQKPLAYVIARSRAPKSAAAYASIGGGSPIVKYTQAQSDLIQAALRERGYSNAKVYFAMRYWYPFTDEALRRIQQDGITQLVIVPLYPQYSISTSGSSFKVLQDAFTRQPSLWGPQKIAYTVVPSWYQRPGYIRAMSRLILNEVRAFSETEMRQGLHVLFSAHGVPVSYIAAGDPYQKQIEECVRLIATDVGLLLRTSPNIAGTRAGLFLSHSTAKLLAGPEITTVKYNFPTLANVSSVLPPPSVSDSQVKDIRYHLSFQSRVGPVQWLQPYTDDTLKQLGKEQGVRNLIVVPISFVSEHIETLEEIDMEYRELALDSGVTHWQRVPALNTDPAFIRDMADLVENALAMPPLQLADVAATNQAFLRDQACPLSTRPECIQSLAVRDSRPPLMGSAVCCSCYEPSCSLQCANGCLRDIYAEHYHSTQCNIVQSFLKIVSFV